MPEATVFKNGSWGTINYRFRNVNSAPMLFVAGVTVWSHVGDSFCQFS